MATRDCHAARKIDKSAYKPLYYMSEALSQVLLNVQTIFFQNVFTMNPSLIMGNGGFHDCLGAYKTHIRNMISWESQFFCLIETKVS